MVTVALGARKLRRRDEGDDVYCDSGTDEKQMDTVAQEHALKDADRVNLETPGK